MSVLPTSIFALMMEAVNISETSVNFYQTVRRNNPEDGHLHTLKDLTEHDLRAQMLVVTGL
jgi:hypothetical protein